MSVFIEGLLGNDLITDLGHYRCQLAILPVMQPEYSGRTRSADVLDPCAMGPPATKHYNDVIMGTIASQIISLTSDCLLSIVYSDAGQRKHQSSASLAFVRGIRRGPVNSPHRCQYRGKCFHLVTSTCQYDYFQQGYSPNRQHEHAPYGFESRTYNLKITATIDAELGAFIGRLRSNNLATLKSLSNRFWDNKDVKWQ